jgi:hypothetical protein
MLRQIFPDIDENSVAHNSVQIHHLTDDYKPTQLI